MKYWENFLQNEKKWQVFLQLMVAILIIGSVLSLLTKITFIEDDVTTRPKIAVIAPDTLEGESLKQGVELYAKTINAMGGYKGRNLEIVSIAPDSDKIFELVTDEYLVGAVGFLDAAALTNNYKAFNNANIPLVTPIYLSEPLEGVVSMGVSPVSEASFAANYARNIARQRIMYVVRQQGSEYDSLIESFDKVYKRFDTPVQNIWEISANPSREELKAVIDNIKTIDIGGLYIATDSALAALLVKEIRETGSILDIFAPSQLASSVFIKKLQELAGENAKAMANGITASTPMLFDTANDEAQRFQSKYQQVFGVAPDWLAALAFDAAQISLLDAEQKSFQGVTGNKKIVANNVDLPMQVGIFNGDRIISAPTQMLPIAKGTNFNYVDALRDGRVLYVNDRFMFKTNVVYTGFTINEISKVDTLSETADINLSIWFRFQGEFKPEDVSVLNSADKVIALGEPEESSNNGDVQYRRYRVTENFKINFTGDTREYDHHIVGITFRHRVLNRNNLMYVVDVLGMPTGSELIDDLKKRKVNESGGGWVVENAWVSQDIQSERGEGAPQYVGITGEQPLFSTITLGIEIEPESLAARDIISIEYFIYIAIFGFVGVLFANILDTRSQAWYWAMQSWVLRLIFWPLLLLSVGNLIIDWSYTNFTQNTTATGVMLYKALWWLLAVHIINLAIKRFIWIPLENRAERKIPNVMKILVTIIMLSFAMAGIIATVFDQSLTSFLATSGVLAMIIGFAVQANISNVFSGIVLNIERPFKVGDFIKVNNVIGQVRDITWRTVRIESNEGPMVSFANSAVSEAFMENYSEVPHGILSETVFYTPPEANIERVLEIITEGIADNSAIIMKDNPMYEPRPRFKGIENLNGQWVAKFSAGYRVQILPKKGLASQELWFYVRAKCKEEGIQLIQANASGPVVTVPAI